MTFLENTTAYSISSNNRNAYSKKPAYEKKFGPYH